MKKLYSLLACSGAGEQSNANYVGSPVRLIAMVVGAVALYVNLFTSSIFEWICFIYFFVCMVLSVIGNNKPSIFHTMPTDYKKRTLCYFIALLLRTLFVIFVIFAVIVIITVLCMISDALSGVENVEESVGEEEVVEVVSAAAIWFSVFRTLFFCGGISGIARIQDKKYYLIGVLAFILIYVMGGFGLCMLVARDSQYQMMLWLYANFEKLPLPWLATALCGLFAVCACVCSVLYVLQIEKPKAF